MVFRAVKLFRYRVLEPEPWEPRERSEKYVLCWRQVAVMLRGVILQIENFALTKTKTK